MGEIKSTTWHL